MKKTMEVVLFKGLDGVSSEQMWREAQAVSPRLERFAGFISHSFGVGEDGRFVDVVHWQDRASALSAAEQVLSCPQCQGFFALIDPSSVQMMHFDLV